RWCLVACVSMSMGIAAERAQAQDAAGPWQGWSITPYGWISDAKGRVGGSGTASEINLTAEDLLKSVNVAIMTIGERRWADIPSTSGPGAWSTCSGGFATGI